MLESYGLVLGTPTRSMDLESITPFNLIYSMILLLSLSYKYTQKVFY